MNLTLHEYARSGNCYKIRLTAAHRGVAIERREYDIMAGATRTAGFLGGVNANGRIPVLQVGDRFLPESNAACWYLAEGSALIAGNPFDRADMLRWMFFEQYNHEPNVATLRWWRAFVGVDNLTEAQRAQIPARMAAGEAALALMDEHLRTRAFFIAERFGLADIALFAYTHVAGEGGFDLDAYPAVRAWIARIEALPEHIPIDA